MPFTEPITDRDYWQKQYESVRAENLRLVAMLRQKDDAMGVLFERLAKAGVDCSDLVS